jgi:hypothetical protein
MYYCFVLAVSVFCGRPRRRSGQGWRDELTEICRGEHIISLILFVVRGDRALLKVQDTRTGSNLRSIISIQ